MAIDLTPNNIELIPIKDKILIFDPESDPSLGLGARVGGLGGTPASAVSDAINNEGNLVTDIINARLDTAAETILGNFIFGVSGAIQIGTYEAGVSGDVKISPAGIIGRNSSNENTFALDATTGEITAIKLVGASGDIGGWNISATALYYDGATDALSAGMASADYPFYAGKKYVDRATAPFRVTPTGALVATSATITGALTAGAGSSLGVSYLSGTIAQANLNIADRGWTQTCVFSATDLNTVSWGAGTFTSADGTAYNIEAGNTGNMSAKTYIYLDIAVSTTVYQITTTVTTAVGVGKVLIGVAQNAADTATFALTETTQIVGDNILVNTIAASKIVTGQLIVGTNVGLGTAQDSAGVTTIIGGTVTTSFVNALNITALGTVTAGSFVCSNTGYIRGGQTAYNTGTGFFLGYDTDAYKFSIGNASDVTKLLLWDGTDLIVNNTKLLGQPIYGDGSDGDVDINSGAFSSGPITSNALTRDAYFDDLTLSGGNLNCAGYRLFVRGILTINSGYKIQRDGNNGTAGSDGVSGAGGAGGAGGTVLSSNNLYGSPAVGAGGAGGTSGSGSAGAAGGNIDAALGGNGVAGGAGGIGRPDTAGGAGGAGGTATSSSMTPRSLPLGILMYEIVDGVYPKRFKGLGGSGGGGGGGRNSTYSGSSGGGGGGGGSNGGIMIILAREIINNGSIEVNGGNGGDGGDAYLAGGGGGGGGGGSGGVMVLIYNIYSGSGTKTVNGGTGGTGGIKADPGGMTGSENGVNGSTGSAGVLIELQF